MSHISRDEVRIEFANRVRDRVVTSAQLAQAVYDHQIGSFGTENPVILVTAGGTGRPPMTLRGTRAEFYIELHIFVLYALEDGTWTEAQSETRLDRIEAEIGAMLTDPLSSPLWSEIDYYGRTIVEPVQIGGAWYRYEIVPLVIRKF
jgi:hypothetical protein